MNKMEHNEEILREIQNRTMIYRNLEHNSHKPAVMQLHTQHKAM